MYLDANNLYGWAMSQKLPVNSFEWDENIHKFNEDFIKNYDEDNTKGYFLEVDVEYSKNLFNDHSDFQFLPERKKIKKCNKFFVPYKIKRHIRVCIVHTRALEQALNHGLILKI